MTTDYHFPAVEGEPFAAYYAAERFCHMCGWCVGSMQAGAPTACFEGTDGIVSKWRNLSMAERREAVATIESAGNWFRDIDVIVRER